jgi:hypothetical protein
VATRPLPSLDPASRDRRVEPWPDSAVLAAVDAYLCTVNPSERPTCTGYVRFRNGNLDLPSGATIGKHGGKRLILERWEVMRTSVNDVLKPSTKIGGTFG